jgi:hypothetical protein
MGRALRISLVYRPVLPRAVLLLFLLAVEAISLISDAQGLPAPTPSRLPARPGTTAGGTVRGGGANGSSAGLAMTRSELAVVVGNGLAGLLRGFDTVFATKFIPCIIHRCWSIQMGWAEVYSG